MVRKVRGVQRQLTDPSPAEIRRRTEAIRRSWSDHELSRRANSKPISWMPPILAATELPEMSWDLDAGAHG
jgi:hypothetical protein